MILSIDEKILECRNDFKSNTSKVVKLALRMTFENVCKEFRDVIDGFLFTPVTKYGGYNRPGAVSEIHALISKKYSNMFINNVSSAFQDIDEMYDVHQCVPQHERLNSFYPWLNYEIEAIYDILTDLQSALKAEFNDDYVLIINNDQLDIITFENNCLFCEKTNIFQDAIKKVK